jgi:hypothetical protein
VQLIHLPLLAIQRALYALPRGRPRFDAYIARMTGPNGELRLPLTAMNPMAREHVAHAVDAWLAAGAEDAAAAAIAEAETHVSAAAAIAEAQTQASAAADGAQGGSFVARDATRVQVGLLVADDVAGGWTNRYTTDFANRFESEPLLRRDFAVGLLWASAPADVAVARREALRACGRAVWQRTRGFGRTVRALLAQEHFALRLAGELPKPLPDARFLDATDPGTVFAVLYGDEGARALGHPPLGVEPALQ